MVPITAHRPHRPESATAARKRRRVDKADPKKLDRDWEGVALDSLQWSSVSLPDRLDDAEGFFGLEEISDVEILQDTKMGTMKCRVSKKNADKAAPRPLTIPTDGKLTTIPAGIPISRDEENEGDEWEGIDDTSVDACSPLPSAPAEPKASKTETALKSVNTNGHKGLLRDDLQTFNRANTFEVLEDTLDDEGDVSAWKHLSLSSETLSSLAKLRFTSPTAIQASAIPEIMNGCDVIGKASTGSGKTLAFGIPILEWFIEHCTEDHRQWRNSPHMRKIPPVALILSPTRELAHQLSTHLTDLCSKITSKNPTIATITGGLSLQKQERILINADIIIGTPGRLWEVISGSRDFMPLLRQIRFLVLDEADRLLSEGHYQEIEEILNALDRTDSNEALSKDGEANEVSASQTKRQTLVFSATFEKALQQKLSGPIKKAASFDFPTSTNPTVRLLDQLTFRQTPKFIDASPLSHLVPTLHAFLLECAALEKDLYLYAALLTYFPYSRSLIFTNSITSVRRLTPFLQNLNIPAHALHSQMPQKARLRSLERFSARSPALIEEKAEIRGGQNKKKGSILVATDVAARGLDIPSVDLVIHYHLPRTAETYIHRSGRTARKGVIGTSLLLSSPEEAQGVRRLVAKVHQNQVANNSNQSRTSAKKPLNVLSTLSIDRTLVARLKPRVTLSKKIADSGLAKEKRGHEDNWLRNAADELGVEYDEEEFAAENAAKQKKGRRKKEEEARGLGKEEVAAMRRELNGLLERRVNVGVSERYLTAAGIDIEALLERRGEGEFLGKVDGLSR